MTLVTVIVHTYSLIQKRKEFLTELIRVFLTYTARHDIWPVYFQSYLIWLEQKASDQSVNIKVEELK